MTELFGRKNKKPKKRKERRKRSKEKNAAKKAKGDASKVASAGKAMRQKRFDVHYTNVLRALDMDLIKFRCQQPLRDLLCELPVVKGKLGDQHSFQDNDSKILAVAHLDTVQPIDSFCIAADVAGDTLVFNPKLDDRLGAYTILDLLPKLGIKFDILFSENEEKGRSTAADFETDKEYNWIVEFDRCGTDVVTYSYNWPKGLLEKYFEVGHGTCSDICYMEHVGAKGMNVGIAYKGEHGRRCYFVLQDYIAQIARWLVFYEDNCEVHFDHIEGTGYRTHSYGSTKWPYHKSYANQEIDEEELIEQYAGYGVTKDIEFHEQCEYCHEWLPQEDMKKTVDGYICELCCTALTEIIEDHRDPPKDPLRELCEGCGEEKLIRKLYEYWDDGVTLLICYDCFHEMTEDREKRLMDDDNEDDSKGVN